METIIINIDENIASAFNVTKNAPINIKGLPKMELAEKQDVLKFLKILKEKFNIDNFKEIDMTIYLVNQNANKDILKELRAELENAYNFYENSPENTIELKKKNDAEVKQLKEKLNKLQEKLDKLTKENKSLKEKLEKLESVPSQQVSVMDDKNISSEKQEEANLPVPVSEIEKLKEDERRICRVELGRNLVLDNDLYFHHEKFYVNRKGFNVTDGDYVEEGDIIGFYNFENMIFEGMDLSDDNCFKFTAKLFGKIFYLLGNNETVKPNQIVAVIGEPNWTREDAQKFVADFEKRELSLPKKTESEIEKRICRASFGNELLQYRNVSVRRVFFHSEYNSSPFMFFEEYDSKYVEVGKKIGSYGVFDKSYFHIESKCFGKLFYLLSYGDVSSNPNQIVAVIGEPNWTEKDVINFFKKNNLLSEVVKENLDDTYKTLLENESSVEKSTGEVEDRGGNNKVSNAVTDPFTSLLRLFR